METVKNYWKIRIFIITWIAYAGFYLCRKNFSIVMPFMQDEVGIKNDEFALIYHII